jgi:hypothetical protein
LLSKSHQETRTDADFYAPDNDSPETSVTQPAPEQVIIYNFQHDLESIWWILMWTLTARVPHNPSRDFASKIFQNRISLTRERADCITEDITERLSACLEKSLLRFVRPLERLRLAMRREYVIRAKKNELFVRGSYSNIHAIFVSFFRGFDLANSNWRAMRLGTNEPQPRALAPRTSSQPGGTLQPAAAAPDLLKPGRCKRPRAFDPADYELSEPETQSEEADSEDEQENENEKDTMGRKKARPAHAETGL